MRRSGIILALVVSTLSLVPEGAVTAGPPPKPRTASAPVVDEDLGRRAGLSSQDLTDASRLYTAKCMRCHKSYEPAAYSDPEWNTWMLKMRKKAHLAPGQEKLLSRYLDTYRSAHPFLKTNVVANDTEITAR